MLPRNFFLVVILVFFTGCASREHLLFDAIPIDGSLGDFANALTKKGFTIADSSKKDAMTLHGRFMNRDCTLELFGTGNLSVAYKVVVSFPKEIQDSLQAGFLRIQKKFNLEYGTGASQYQKYKKRERLLYNVPGLALELRKGDFTRYTTDSGEILLEVRDGYCSITYLDAINKEIREPAKE